MQKFPVFVGGKPTKVTTDLDVQTDPSHWRLSRTSPRGKLVLSGKGGEGALMRSIPAQLYGLDYTNAQHVVADPYDWRRTAFRPSKARANRKARKVVHPAVVAVVEPTPIPQIVGASIQPETFDQMLKRLVGKFGLIAS